jgi:hypothetical protein
MGQKAISDFGLRISDLKRHRVEGGSGLPIGDFRLKKGSGLRAQGAGSEALFSRQETACWREFCPIHPTRHIHLSISAAWTLVRFLHFILTSLDNFNENRVKSEALDFRGISGLELS